MALPLDDDRHVVILGLMASGKSSVGRLVADALGRPFRDNDALLEAGTGRTAAAIAAEEGLDTLHRRELEVLATALADDEPSVVTAAASVADRPERLQALLDGHAVVLLDAPVAVLAERAGTDASGHRPLESSRGAAITTLGEMAETRLPAYRAVADIVVAVDVARPPEVAARIVEELTASGHP